MAYQEEDEFDQFLGRRKPSFADTIGDLLIGASSYIGGNENAFLEIEKQRQQAAAYRIYNQAILAETRMSKLQYDEAIRRKRLTSIGQPQLSVGSSGVVAPGTSAYQGLDPQAQQNIQSAIQSGQSYPVTPPSQQPIGLKQITRDPATGETTETFGNLDYEAALQTIQNLSPKQVTPEEKSDLADNLSSIDAMDSLLHTVNTFKDYFGQELGPLKLQNYPNAIGNFVKQLKKDAKLSAFALDVETTFQQVRKVVTGASASTSELTMLRPLTPQLSDPLPVFVAKTLAFRNSATRVLDRKLKVLQAGGSVTRSLREQLNELVSYTQADYEQQLLISGVDPEGAKKLTEIYVGQAQKRVKRFLRLGGQSNKGVSNSSTILQRLGLDPEKYEIVS